MRLPTYRSSHGRRHHPYPQSKRAFARRTFAVRPSVYTATASGDSPFSIQQITVNDHRDEVSARAQVPLSETQLLGVATDNFATALHPDSDFGGDQARNINLFTMVLDLALVLKRKYFT